MGKISVVVFLVDGGIRELEVSDDDLKGIEWRKVRGISDKKNFFEQFGDDWYPPPRMAEFSGERQDGTPVNLRLHIR